jgi:hypothetical protein
MSMMITVGHVPPCQWRRVVYHVAKEPAFGRFVEKKDELFS